ncbi:MAK10-like protein [Tanacetum coccineum]
MTSMGDENPMRTLGDYSKPSHEGYQNTIELPEGNNVVPLRSDTIRLVQNECSFHGLRSEDPNQHLKDFLKLMDSIDLDVANRERTRLRSISTWEDLTTRFLAQFFPPGRTAKLRNDILMFQQHQRESISESMDSRTIDQSVGGKLCDRNAKESWALLEDLALYENESWNDARDFAKPVKEISLPQDVLSASDCRLIELKNQYCMENPEQAFVDYASSRNDEEGEEQNRNPSSPKHVHFINSIIILSKESEAEEEERIKPNAAEYKDHKGAVEAKDEVKEESKEEFEEETEEETKEKEEDNPEYFDTFPQLTS